MYICVYIYTYIYIYNIYIYIYIYVGLWAQGPYYARVWGYFEPREHQQLEHDHRLKTSVHSAVVYAKHIPAPDPQLNPS